MTSYFWTQSHWYRHKGATEGNRLSFLITNVESFPWGKQGKREPPQTLAGSTEQSLKTAKDRKPQI